MGLHALTTFLLVISCLSSGYSQNPDASKEKGGFRSLALKRKTIEISHSEDSSLGRRNSLRSALFPGFVDEHDEEFDEHFFQSSDRFLQNAVPIFGEYRRLAYYYAMVYIGNPRQRFSVIADTGSNLMAVPCKGCTVCGKHMNPYYDIEKSNQARWITCADGCPINQKQDHCSTQTNVCKYVQRYAEGSSIGGDIVEDMVFMGGANDFDANTESGIGSFGIPFKFGCGKHEDNLFVTQEADGIMGLGQGSTSFVRQLWDSGKLTENVFSLCLTMDGGAFTIGEIDHSLHLSPVQWAKMSLSGFYQVHVNGMAVDGTNIPVERMKGPTNSAILDSGTTFTYVPNETYNAIRAAIDSFCAKPGNCIGQEKKINGEKLCYEFTNPESQLSTFPFIDLQLEGFDNSEPLTIRIPPEHLFLNMAWSKGAYCFSIYENGSRNAVLGANTMMGMDVVFHMGDPSNNKGPKVGFAPSLCSLPDDSDTPTPLPTPAATPTPTPTSTNTHSETPSPSPEGEVVPPSPSGIPSTVTPVPTPTATSSSEHGSQDPDDSNDDDKGGDDTFYNRVTKQPGLVSFLSGLVVVSILAVGYFLATCEVNLGRLHVRLGAGPGRYASVGGSENSEQAVEATYTDDAPGGERTLARIPSDAAIISVIPDELDLRSIDPNEDGSIPGTVHVIPPTVRGEGKANTREQQRRQQQQVQVDDDIGEAATSEISPELLEEIDVELGNIMHQFDENDASDRPASTRSNSGRGNAPTVQSGSKKKAPRSDGNK